MLHKIFLTNNFNSRWRESQWESCGTNQRLDGKIVVITGASSGLGKVLAEDLAKRGAVVVLACRDLTAARAVITEIKQHYPEAKMVTIQI